jgi:predicted MPP superfamily phosphohydrolase
MPLTILHISDVHLNEEKLKDFSQIREAIINDAAELRAKHDIMPNLALFSGDLVQSGNKLENFDFARGEVIDPILKSFGIDWGSFFLCPGNHDMDRDCVRRNKTIENGQRQTLVDRASLNEFIDQHIHVGHDHFQFARLTPFHQFRRTLSGVTPIRETPFFATYAVEIDNDKVGIASLNTAWRTTGEPNDVDYGHLLLGERAVQEALRDLNDCTIKIAMMHHPRGWLREFDQNDCWSLLVREADLILTGHIHRSKPESVQNPLGQAITSEGGALYVSRNWFNGYCVIRLDHRTNTANFFIRRYEDAQPSFEPATNVAKNGEFLIELASSEAARHLARLNTSLQALRPMLQKLANEKLITLDVSDGQSSSFASSYVPIRLSNRSIFERTTASTPAKTDRVESRRGAREAGKTVLGLKLCIDACEGLKPDVKIPIFIDLALVKAGTGYIERATREFLGRAELALNVAEAARAGTFLFVFDNFAARERNKDSRQRKIKMVTDFIRANPSNKYVLLSNMYEASRIGISPPEKYGFDHASYYIESVGRTEIRQFGKRWLEPLGMYSEALVLSVERKLATFHLPRTPQILAIIFWTVAKEGGLGAINEASLLERLVELLLNKSSVQEIERGSLDFRIKEAFVSHLADKLGGRDLPVIAKDELLQFAIEFFEKRWWPSDSSVFVDDLIDSGILSEYYSEDGSVEVSFRYGCLREFFSARYLSENHERFNEIVRSNEIADFDRELDLLTGLTKTDHGLIKILAARASELSLGPEAPAVEQAFNRLKFSVFDPRHIVEATVSGRAYAQVHIGCPLCFRVLPSDWQ